DDARIGTITLNRVWHRVGRLTCPHVTRGTLLPAHTASDAEIVGVDHRALHLLLLALDAEVGDPVLPATIRASGDVDLQVLIEAGHPRLHLLHQPAREALGLGERELAELRARARDRPAPER